MRLAIVSPHYPPDRCGVGDYTARLARALTEAGHEVLVATARVAPLADAAPRVRISTRPYPWRPARLGSITDEIRDFRPDAISVQYTPYLYAPHFYGIQPLLPAWIAWLRERTGAPVALTAHERHYPVGLTVDQLLVGGPQWAIFRALVLASDHVFFTNECFRDDYQKLHPKRRERFSWLPVGANIEPDVAPDLATPRESATLLQFGSAHPTRLSEYCFRALQTVQAEIPDTRLLLVGVNDGPPGTEALGYLTPAEVSGHLSRATLLLAPFLDGVSTRRGSVMAALAHGCPVLTTRGPFTDPTARWELFCALVDVKDAAGFARTALELIRTPSRRHALAAEGLGAYQARFEWARIAAEMTTRLESSRKPR